MRLVNGHGVAAADPGSPVVRTGAAELQAAPIPVGWGSIP